MRRPPGIALRVLRRVSLIVAALLVLVARRSSAQSTFSSRATFLAVLGGAQVQVYDFNSVPLSPSLSDPIAGIGPLTFSSPNGTQTFVVGPGFDPVFQFGTGNVLSISRGQNPLVFTITSPTPLSAFGIDFGEPSDPCCVPVPFTFALDNGFAATALATGSGPAGGIKTFQFFGVSSPTPFSQVTITVNSGAFLNATFDNVTTLDIVPEPRALALLATGLPILAVVTWRHRARRA
jgi:hypothetical protein